MGGEGAMPLEGELTIYLASGKRKHSRFFWVDQNEETGLVQISWGKSLRSKTCKTKSLIAVEEKPTLRDPRTIFDEVDDDGSGSLDISELELLYKKARGESLSKKELKNAMAQMDTDGDNQVQFDEFERWWRDNGGDLAKHTEQALTIQAGDLELLLVAPTVDEKQRWVSGCRQLLRSEAVLSGDLGGAMTPTVAVDLSTGIEQPLEHPSELHEFMQRGHMLQMYFPNGKFKHERLFSFVPGEEPMLSWAPKSGGKAKTAVIVSVQRGAEEAPEELQKFARTLITMVVRPQVHAATDQELLLVAPDRRTRRLWLAGCQYLLMRTAVEDAHGPPAPTSDLLSELPSKSSATLETTAPQAQPTAEPELLQGPLPSTHSSQLQESVDAPRDLFDWVDEPAGDESSQTLKRGERRPKYPWMQLSPAMRAAAGALGYAEDRWPLHPNDEGGSWPHWDELNDLQKDAAALLGIKAKDWHSEKLEREIEIVYVDPGRLGIGFANGTVPLRVSSVVGKSQGRGVEVGMWLSKVQGQKALRSGPFADAVEQLAAHATRRPLALVFANTV